MTWLTPIGFLGLIGLIVLLIIYLIKPNYQNKMISSTFVWKLSLKYRKKRIPVSKLRNLLLIIAQVLAICACAAILAQPHIMSEESTEQYAEKIVILDASASMLTQIEGETRFDRAVSDIQSLADEVFDKDSRITVILAAGDPTFVCQRAGADSKAEVKEKLLTLTDPAAYQCSYGAADIEGAIKLAEEVTAENPECDVLLYTGNTYIDSGNVEIKNIADENEWNLSILNATAELVEGYFEIRIDVACYGKDTNTMLYVDVYDAEDENGALRTMRYALNVRCTGDEVQTLVLCADEKRANEVFRAVAYDYVHVYVQENDSFTYDNTMYLYGGSAPTLRVQYVSSLPNPFFEAALYALRGQMREEWNFDVKRVDLSLREEYEMEGFDIYVFEHTMPETLPDDGLIILANPGKAPANAGFYLGGKVGSGQNSVALHPGEEESALMNRIDATKITVSQYTKFSMYDDDYVPLMYCGDDPVVLAKNELDAKVVVMSFSLNYSNFAVSHYFPLFMYNLIENCIPSTVEEHVYEVYDSVTLNSRGEDLSVVGPGVNQIFTEFPAQITVTQPGAYTLTQTPISGIEVVESFFVKIPAEECNTARTVETLSNPYTEKVDEGFDYDLLLYFAVALVALLFAEWWLQSREYF